MDMKKGIVVLKAFVFLLIFAVLFFGVQEVIQYKVGQGDFLSFRYDAYLEEPEDSIDILFIGSSQTYAGIAPALIWKETGMTSINLSATSAPALASYYQLRFALETQKPSLVVMDFVDICTDRMAEDEKHEPTYRKYVAALPGWKLKMEMLLQMGKDNPNLDILTYLSPLLRDHSRWNEITKDDFSDTFAAASFSDRREMLKGALFRLEKPSSEIIYDSELFEQETEELPISEYSWGYYRKALDLCAENGIPVAVLNFPEAPYRRLIQQYKTLESVCAENGLNYYNMNLPVIWKNYGFDTEVDFYDNGHVNASGAIKVSKALAKILQEDFDLPDHRGDSAYSAWDDTWDAFYAAYENVLAPFGY